MRRRFEATLGIALVAFAAAACDRETWRVGASVRASDEAVAVALGDTEGQAVRVLTPDRIPDVPYPRSLRPCCAFGADLEVELGSTPVPGVEVGNLIGPSDVGPHRYDNGFASLDRSDRRGTLNVENNGLLYTCRGGFIDLAHLRDNADNTIALAAAVLRRMDTGGILDVPAQGADMRVRFEPIPIETIAQLGEQDLAVALAQWLAFQI